LPSTSKGTSGSELRHGRSMSAISIGRNANRSRSRFNDENHVFEADGGRAAVHVVAKWRARLQKRSATIGLHSRTRGKTDMRLVVSKRIVETGAGICYSAFA
jgi:hypothetical protein